MAGEINVNWVVHAISYRDSSFPSSLSTLLYCPAFRPSFTCVACDLSSSASPARREAVRNSHHFYEISKFAEAVFFGSAIPIPDSLTPQVVLLWRALVISSVVPPNRYGRKFSFRASSNVTNSGRIPGLLSCSNCNSCYSDIVRIA